MLDAISHSYPATRGNPVTPQLSPLSPRVDSANSADSANVHLSECRVHVRAGLKILVHVLDHLVAHDTIVRVVCVAVGDKGV